MAPKKANWQQDLERMREDASVWQSLSPSSRKTLIEHGYVDKNGVLIEQTPPTGWRVEYLTTVKGEEQWQRQYSPAGEIMQFETQELAEKAARQLSVLNVRFFRVVQHTIAPTFIVYDYGQRYIQDGLTGIRTRIEDAPFNDEEGQEDDPYYLQSRDAYIGRTLPWDKNEAASYLEIEEAASAAVQISKANPKREYRVVLGETNLSPEPAVYRRGDRLPNVDVLAQLLTFVDARATGEALVSLLTLWKGADSARALVDEMHTEVHRS